MDDLMFPGPWKMIENLDTEQQDDPTTFRRYYVWNEDLVTL